MVTRRDNQRTNYKKDRQVFLWQPSSLGQPEDRLQEGQTILPLATISGRPQDRVQEGQTSLPLATLSGQPEDRLQEGQASLPLVTLLGQPEDRLHKGQTSLPLANLSGQPEDTTKRIDALKKMADGKILVSVLEGSFAGLQGVGIPLPVSTHLQELELQHEGAQWTAKQSNTGFSMR